MGTRTGLWGVIVWATGSSPRGTAQSVGGVTLRLIRLRLIIGIYYDINPSQPSAVHGDVSKGSPQNYHPGQDRSVNRSKAAGTVAHGGGASTFGPGGRGHGHCKRGRGPGSGKVTPSGAG